MQKTTTSERTSRRVSIRTYLLLCINVPLVIASTAFLALDYRSTLTRRIADKRISLDEESRILLSAIEVYSQDDRSRLQRMIDLACGRMQDATSPGHHIVVRMQDHTLQAAAHHRASPQYLEAMQLAVGREDGQAVVDGQTIVVGSAGHGGNVVFVSELVANVIRAIQLQLLLRLAGGAAVVVLSLLLIDIFLARAVIGPLRRMSEAVRRIGGGELGIQVATGASRELYLVGESVNAMSNALADAERRRDAQMRKAQRIQENLQPIHTSPTGLSLAFSSRPADDVGGDFVDFAEKEDGTLVLCVADVTGHGVPAAMGAAMLKVLFDAAIERRTDPGDILTFMNRAFQRVALEGDFATAVAIAVSPDRRWCHYAGAGHEPIILLRNDGTVESLESTGMILGIDSNAVCDVRHLSLRRGDRIVIYTDGLVEAAAADGKQFGRDRLASLMNGYRQIPVDRFCDAVIDDLRSYTKDGEQEDDMTLLAIEIPNDQ